MYVCIYIYPHTHIYIYIYIYILILFIFLFFQITFPIVWAWLFPPRVIVRPKVCIRLYRSEADLCCLRRITSEVWITRATPLKKDSGSPVKLPLIPMGNHIYCLWVGNSSSFSWGKVDLGYIFSFYQIKWEKKSWLFLMKWRSHLHYKTIIIV